MPASYTLPGNLVSTFDVGFFPSDTAIHHEDLTDVVTILDSFQAPFFSGAPKLRARDMVHSWPIDTLTAITTAGAPDGVDFNGDALNTPVRLWNTVQEFRYDVIVSDREREANPAGIRDMYQHQVMKQFKSLTRNGEAAVFKLTTTTASASTGVETSAASAAPLLAGFRGVFASSTTITVIGQAATPTTGGVATSDVVIAAQTLFVNGAEPDSIWFAPSSKLQWYNATQGSAINVRNIAATDQRLVANVDVFETPFGQMFAVITDRFIPMVTGNNQTGAFFVGDRSMAKLAFFRPPQHKEMGKNGDHTRGIILMDMTLQIDHPSSWCVVTGVTGATGIWAG
jgi:hypothetical protein